LRLEEAAVESTVEEILAGAATDEALSQKISINTVWAFKNKKRARQRWLRLC
jgi:hypothetical protein